MYTHRGGNRPRPEHINGRCVLCQHLLEVQSTMDLVDPEMKTRQNLLGTKYLHVQLELTWGAWKEWASCSQSLEHPEWYVLDGSSGIDITKCSLTRGRQVWEIHFYTRSIGKGHRVHGDNTTEQNCDEAKHEDLHNISHKRWPLSSRPGAEHGSKQYHFSPQSAS